MTIVSRACVLGLLLIGCSNVEELPNGPAGGSSGSGGAAQTSGGSGGQSGTGGASGASGSSGTGGVSGTGGTSETGGASGTGGSAGAGTGGTGGAAGAGTGGTTGTGGTGGAGTGGAAGTGTGGAAGTGGAGTGGTGGAGTGGTVGSGTGGTGGALRDAATADGPMTGSVDGSPTADSGAPDVRDAAAGADAAPATGLALTYKTSDSYVRFEFAIAKSGTSTVPLSALTVRYYMKTETVPGASDIHIDYAGWTGPNPPYSLGLTADCQATYKAFQPGTAASPSGDAGELTPADAGSGTPGAGSDSPDGYIEIHCANAQTLASGEKVNMQVRLDVSNALNDYSYQASREFAPNAHLVLLQAGTVLSGVAP
jgi:hypothetical protein